MAEPWPTTSTTLQPVDTAAQAQMTAASLSTALSMRAISADESSSSSSGSSHGDVSSSCLIVGGEATTPSVTEACSSTTAYSDDAEGARTTAVVAAAPRMPLGLALPTAVDTSAAVHPLTLGGC